MLVPSLRGLTSKHAGAISDVIYPGLGGAALGSVGGALINQLRGEDVSRGAFTGALTGAGALVGGTVGRHTGEMVNDDVGYLGSVGGLGGGGYGGYQLAQAIQGLPEEPDPDEEEDVLEIEGENEAVLQGIKDSLDDWEPTKSAMLVPSLRGLIRV